MSLRVVATDLSVGPVRIRLEVIPIAIGVGVVAGAADGVSFVLAVAVHELGHLVAARALGLGADRLVLQVTGGGTYIRDARDARARILVLLAGPLASLLLALLALTAHALGAEAGMKELFYGATVWTVYQLTPFPPLDGGLLLRTVLAGRVRSATFAWRLGWVLGLLIALGFVLADSTMLEPVVLLTGMAVVLGRGESGYVRHLDAYSAWERGDHRVVITQALRVPDYLEHDDKTKIRELGLFSAMEAGDIAAVESITAELSASRPVVVAAAEWLIVRGHSHGAQLAQHALDAIDAELVRPTSEERERLADLVVAFAAFEARGLRHDSALGLLERAIELGYTYVDRLEADGDLRALSGHPRYLAVVARARGAPP